MANIFLENNENFPLAASNSTVFGRAGGSETLQIFDGVTGVTTDSNIERIDLSGNLADHSFEATTNGLEISRAGQVVATVQSLNQDLDLRAGTVMSCSVKPGRPSLWPWRRMAARTKRSGRVGRCP